MRLRALRAPAAAFVTVVGLCLTGSAPSSALPVPRAVSRTDAPAVANKIKLRAGDLGLRRAASVSANPAGGETVVHCAQVLPSYRPWGEASPSVLTNRAQTLAIGSGSLIVATAKVAGADLRALDTTKARGCVAASFRSHLASGLPQSRVSVTGERRASAFRGGTDRLGIRLVVRLRAPSGATAGGFYVDVFLAVYGQAIVQLSVESGTPPPGRFEGRLAALLLSRAHAALA